MGCIRAMRWKVSSPIDLVRQLAPDRLPCPPTPKLDCLRASRQGPSKPTDLARPSYRQASGLKRQMNDGRCQPFQEDWLQSVPPLRQYGTDRGGMVLVRPWAWAIDRSRGLSPARRHIRGIAWIYMI